MKKLIITAAAMVLAFGVQAQNKSNTEPAQVTSPSAKKPAGTKQDQQNDSRANDKNAELQAPASTAIEATSTQPPTRSKKSAKTKNASNQPTMMPDGTAAPATSGDANSSKQAGNNAATAPATKAQPTTRSKKVAPAPAAKPAPATKTKPAPAPAGGTNSN